MKEIALLCTCKKDISLCKAKIKCPMGTQLLVQHFFILKGNPKQTLVDIFIRKIPPPPGPKNSHDWRNCNPNILRPKGEFGPYNSLDLK